MTKRERVMAAVRGDPVDRVPVSLWLHNFATENSAETLTAETLRLARRFDWDFLKPQSRAQCFAEMWGLRYAPSRERATPYTVARAPLATADDLRRLEPAYARTGALGEQLQTLHAIRKAVGPDTPIIWTVFSPLMVLPFLLAGGRAMAVSLMRSDPAAVDHALGAMAETLAAYARAAVPRAPTVSFTPPTWPRASSRPRPSAVASSGRTICAFWARPSPRRSTSSTFAGRRSSSTSSPTIRWPR